MLSPSPSASHHTSYDVTRYSPIVTDSITTFEVQNQICDGTFSPNFVQGPSEKLRTTTIIMDDYLRGEGVENVALVKCDAEGYETPSHFTSYRNLFACFRVLIVMLTYVFVDRK